MPMRCVNESCHCRPHRSHLYSCGRGNEVGGQGQKIATRIALVPTFTDPQRWSSHLNFDERDQQLSPWLEHYNFRRPHGSLGYAPPISRAAPVGTTS